MRKDEVAKLRSKTVEELEKDLEVLLKKLNNSKADLLALKSQDVRIVKKAKKDLAVVRTIISEKKIKGAKDEKINR